MCSSHLFVLFFASDVHRIATDEAAAARHGVREADGCGERAGEGRRSPADERHL